MRTQRMFAHTSFFHELDKFSLLSHTGKEVFQFPFVVWIKISQAFFHAFRLPPAHAVQPDLLVRRAHAHSVMFHQVTAKSQPHGAQLFFG